jgi:hypothetical protein
LLSEPDVLVEPTARGDPQSSSRSTCKSTPRLAKKLAERGHGVSQCSVCDLLARFDYRLQATHKTREGGKQPDRDARFSYIAGMAAQYQAMGKPVVSVDTDLRSGGW